MADVQTASIDQEILGRLLLRIEADSHRGGWDAPSRMFVVYDARHAVTDRTYRGLMSSLGPTIRCGPYAACQAVPTSAMDGYASHAALRMALNLGTDHPAARMLVDHWRQPGFLGFALMCETWSRQMTAEERGEVRGRRLADIPGSYESRMVTSGDVSGAIRYVCRIRGEAPKLHPTEETFTGSIPQSLVYAAAAVAGLPLPDPPGFPSGWPAG